jgi:EAL domain-containing protein (putative c-di-GMP-specific phosphodiesterase class I)
MHHATGWDIVPHMRDDATSVPPVSDERWRDALQEVVDEPARLVLYAEPIVELAAGTIAGFEMLSRFAGRMTAPPDDWFAAAERWGFNATLQSRVVTAAIAARSALPPDTFLTVNVDPHLLLAPEVTAALTGATDLSRLVVEITEHTELADDPAVGAVLDHIRSAGGLLAMDDAGTGYAGLGQLLRLRPDIVKLDRTLVSGLDRDPVKRALVEVFGDLAGRMDAWILAEGIETLAELDVLIGLGVPLGQGYLLGRAGPAMISALDEELAAHIRSTAARTSLHAHIASLIRPCSVGTDRGTDDVLLAADGRASLVRTYETWAPAMTVAPSSAVAAVARRAMARAQPHRFAPLVCTDGQGRVLGVVRVDDLLVAMCDSRKE